MEWALLGVLASWSGHTSRCWPADSVSCIFGRISRLVWRIQVSDILSKWSPSKLVDRSPSCWHWLGAIWGYRTQRLEEGTYPESLWPGRCRESELPSTDRILLWSMQWWLICVAISEAGLLCRRFSEFNGATCRDDGWWMAWRMNTYSTIQMPEALCAPIKIEIWYSWSH